MILLREVQDKDLDAIIQLAQVPGMFNLQADREALRDRIRHSRASFSTSMSSSAQFKPEAKFVFVAEDVETKRILGTSMIVAQHGTQESPHFYFEVGSEQKYSSAINTGFIHGTLKLKYDTNGPSEIGALVIDPEIRNSEEKIGRQISFIRFLFLGLNRGRFKRKVIAELLPPLNKKGQSPLWEAIGRRFTNMDYWEADALCQKNKEFILSLFPSGKIYTTFLSAEARNAIGKVGKDTEAVVHMLNKIGFQYRSHVDPFDGGPHLMAGVDEITPLKKLVSFAWSESGESGALSKIAQDERGLLASSEQSAGVFRAVAVKISKSSVLESKQVALTLGLKPGQMVTFMPYY